MTEQTTAPDQEPGAPHPRDSFGFFGHEAAEAALADGITGARMHHAWLITGPKGVGKATLAYRAARKALGARIIGPRPFDADADHPLARRIAARAHPDLFVLARGMNERGKPRRDITAEEARALSSFFALQPAEGGRRVAIVDAVDDLNRHAANALLKTLEEPPKGAVLFLVCHAPGGVLATIRSRCRTLALRPVTDEAVRLAARAAFDAEPADAVLRLAAGRPGRAIALMGQDGGALADAVLASLRVWDKGGVRAFMPLVFAGGDRGERLALVLELIRDWVRHAVNAAHGQSPGPLYAAELEAMARLVTAQSAPRWAQAWSDLERMRGELDGLDLDPSHGLARAAAILDRAAQARS